MKMQNYELFTNYIMLVTKSEALIRREILRQLDLQQAGKFKYIPFDSQCSNELRLAMLVEELGEVARALQNNGWSNLKEELIQVAAIATSWIARLEENGVK
jgi:NTP pyrophosphatase (non-canonical NTP hydrolase)